MKVSVFTYKCGHNDMWWTYAAWINSDQLPSPPIIYRMYKKEETALRNGQKLLNKKLKKVFTK